MNSWESHTTPRSHRAPANRLTKGPGVDKYAVEHDGLRTSRKRTCAGEIRSETARINGGGKKNSRKVVEVNMNTERRSITCKW